MSGATRQSALWPWLTLLVVSVGLMAMIAWQIRPGREDLLSVSARPGTPQSTARPAAAERRQVRLFFPQESGETLKELERDIPRRRTLAEEVRAVLRELAAGTPGGQPPLPPGTEVRQVFLDAFGILYLDFGKGIQAMATAPGARPALAISAIVTTLTTSFSEIKRVQFLAEGQEMTIVAGGWDLRRPVSPRFPGEESPPIMSPSQE